jgi:hypothetical protein
MGCLCEQGRVAACRLEQFACALQARVAGLEQGPHGCRKGRGLRLDGSRSGTEIEQAVIDPHAYAGPGVGSRDGKAGKAHETVSVEKRLAC